LSYDEDHTEEVGLKANSCAHWSSLRLRLRLHCAEMSETKGSNSLKQEATGESPMKKPKEGKHCTAWVPF